MRYIHKQMYAEHMKIYSAAISSAKSDYYSNWVTSSEGNARTLFFSVMNDILKPLDSLPSHLFSFELCYAFLTLFSAKTENIY